MFDKLEDLTRRLEEINMLLTEPEVINNQEQYRELMREQSELSPVASKYKEYNARKKWLNVNRSLKYLCSQKTLMMIKM